MRTDSFWKIVEQVTPSELTGAIKRVEQFYFTDANRSCLKIDTTEGTFFLRPFHSDRHIDVYKLKHDKRSKQPQSKNAVLGVRSVEKASRKR